MAKLWIEPEDTIDPTGPYTALAIEAASWLLFKLTAEKYPGKTTVSDCYSQENYSGFTMKPTVVSGQIYNTISGGSRKLHLRQKPVLKVNSVLINGSELDSTKYQLRNNSFLVRTDFMTWNLSPVSEVCVTYDYGLNPPAMGRLAATLLANELIKSYTMPSQCKLPERVTSVSRQNVSFSLLDPHTFLNEGKLGIYLVDAFITTANPGRAKKQPKIFSPDRPHGERIN
jgi:hypothetical protein